MKKLILLCAFCAGMAVPAFAQSYEDIVHLKNGSIIKGTIVEQVPNESLKIQTREGNLFVYKLDEVQKMTKEIAAAGHDGATRSTGSFNKPRGYIGLVELVGGFGVGDYAATRYSATMVNGFRFSPQFAMGLGVGLKEFAYETYYGEEVIEDAIPVFLHLRSDFLNKKVSPFAALNVGYNLAIEDVNRFDGMLLEIGGGVGFNIGSKNRMIAGLSYQMDDFYSGYQTEIGGAINLKVGISF